MNINFYCLLVIIVISQCFHFIKLSEAHAKKQLYFSFIVWTVTKFYNIYKKKEYNPYFIQPTIAWYYI